MNGAASVVRGEKSYLALQIIWFALVVSVLIYVALAYTLINSAGFTAPQVPVNIIFVALAAVSLGILIPQVLLRSFLSDSSLFPRVLEKVRAGHPDKADTRDPGLTILLQNHTTFSIIIWALGEAPAIFGLTLTFLSGDLRYAAGFALYSILNMFIFRPIRTNFEDQAGRFRRYMASRG